MEAAFSTTSSSGTRGRSSAGGARAGSSTALRHHAHCAAALWARTLVPSQGGASGELLLCFLFAPHVVHINHRACMETLRAVSASHLVPFMNDTVLAQWQLSVLTQCLTAVGAPRRGKTPWVTFRSPEQSLRAVPRVMMLPEHSPKSVHKWPAQGCQPPTSGAWLCCSAPWNMPRYIWGFENGMVRFAGNYTGKFETFLQIKSLLSS